MTTKFSININSFKLGSSKDLQNYNSSLDYSRANKLVNFIPRNNNLLTRRPGTNYISTLNNNAEDNIKIIIANFLDSTFVLKFSANKLTIYNNTSQVFELDSPYDSNCIDSLHFCNNNKTSIFLFCKYTKIHLLTRDIHSNTFSLEAKDIVDGPYNDINNADIFLTPATATGDNVLLLATSDAFVYSDVGLSLRLFNKQNNTWGWAIITKVIDSTKITVDIKKSFFNTLSTKYWRKGVFNSYYGYPSLGVIFNSRLYLSASYDNTNTVWVSCYNDLLNFSPTSNLDELNLLTNIPDTITYANSITCNITEITEICWLEASPKYVVFGSPEGIFALMPLDFNKSLSPFNFFIQKFLNNSSNNIFASNNNTLLLYSNSNNLEVLEYSYNSINPSIKNAILPELVQLNNSLQSIYIKDIALSFGCENIITVLLSNGEIFLINVNTVENNSSFAFSEVILGGKNPKIKAICGKSNNLYLIVERTINENSVLTLEYINWQDLNIALFDNINLLNLHYLDCKIVKDNLEENRSVSVNINDKIAVIADGLYIGEFCSSQTEVKLTFPAFKIITGYNYESYYQSVDLRKNINNSSVLTSGNTISEIKIGFINSQEGSVFTNNSKKISGIASNDLADIGNNNFFNGYKSIKTQFIFNNQIIFNIQQYNPYPLTINFINLEIINTAK